MTNEHNFKVGDRVAVKRSYTLIANGYENIIPMGEVGIVENVDGEELLVDFPGYFCALTLNIADVEPIQPLDRRTAFLTRLQSLLREFDARIYDHDDYRLYIDLGIHGEGFERIVYSDTEGEVDADNIMDFDKEEV
ncbi:MAG: hypothetical protein HDR77_02560 [Bacteroides sp.]|nr:hypothetical protein [Bacteroides sp.]